jgi:beta-glucosidase
LDAGESCTVTIEADPRVLARYDGSAGSWRIEDGNYAVAVGVSAVEPELSAGVNLLGRTFGR